MNRPFILLETMRIVLRRFSVADAEHLFALDNDPEVMRYINGGTAVSWQVIQDDILPQFCRYDDHTPLFGFWAIIAKNTGGFLGWLSYRPSAETPHEAVLGYRLRREAWGQGIATEAARALIAQGFLHTDITAVVATTYEKNAASRRVMEKLGMSWVGSFRVTAEDILSADTYHATSADVWEGEDVIYKLTKKKWATANNSQSAP